MRWRVEGDQSVVDERLEPVSGGTRVTVLHTNPSGWSPHELEGIALGWDESLADLALLVEHDIRLTRHLAYRSSLGAAIRNAPAGVEIVAVTAGTFAAELGLRPGDLLVQLGEAPVFDRSDLALITREHEAGTRLEAVFVRNKRLFRQAGALSPRR